MNVCVVGALGAFGRKHLAVIDAIKSAQVTSIVDTDLKKLAILSKEKNIAHYSNNLTVSLARNDVDCVIIATPTPLHASQVIQCLDAGKPVQTEIPMADNIEDAKRILQRQKETGIIAMVGHTRRFNPSHQ